MAGPEQSTPHRASLTGGAAGLEPRSPEGRRIPWRIPVIWFALVAIALGGGWYWQTRGNKTPRGGLSASRASTLHKWMTAFALDNGGDYPVDLRELLSKNYGITPEEADEYFGGVIEYRGGKLSERDDPKRLLMRYRIPGETTREVRLFVSGSASTCAADDPIPEDLLPEPPPSTRREAETEEPP